MDKLGPALLGFALLAMVGAKPGLAAQSLPPVVCVIKNGVNVVDGYSPQTWAGTGSTYRIDRQGWLHKKVGGQKEDRYNTIKNSDYRRWESGHKTIIFEDDFAKAKFVHVNETGVVIEYAECIRTE
jgi:hypothetical protein